MQKKEAENNAKRSVALIAQPDVAEKLSDAECAFNGARNNGLITSEGTIDTCNHARAPPCPGKKKSHEALKNIFIVNAANCNSKFFFSLFKKHH